MDHITILSFIYIAIVVIFLFGLCIFIHELGHFAAARALGMVIDVFSIGFGPAIWKKKVGGVLLKICIFPLGGYVALPQMDPSASGGQPSKETPQNGREATSEHQNKGSAETETRVLPRIGPWKKIIVAVAGALGNILLAYVIAWIVYLAGKPSMPAERSAVIGYVQTNSAAYAGGLRIGDEILAINGRAVNNWQDVIQENARFEKVQLLLKSPSGTNSISLPTEKNPLGFRMVPGIHEVTLCKVLSVEPDSSAALAGIQNGDLIKKIDGIEVLSIDHLIALVSERATMATAVGIERAGRELTVQVTPSFDPDLKRARIGIRFDPLALDFDRVVHITPGAQMKSHSLLVLRVVRSLMTPREAKATSQALGGPLMIIYMFQDMVRKGIIIALWFTCLLNVNLAILNLLPLPVLDGGHVVFALLEIIIRRPVPPKVVLFLDQVFFGLLIMAIILITGRDIKRLYQIRLMSKPPAGQQAGTNMIPAPEAATDDDE